MKTTKEQRATYRSLFAESQSPLASFVKQMLDDLEAAEAEIARLREQTQWRPIETAPKDGTWLILYSTEEGVTVGYWGPTYFDSDYKWVRYNHRSESEEVKGKVTKWMPLPQPPQAQESESE